MTTKELFTKLVLKHGYSSLNQFYNENGLDHSNMSKRLIGQRQKIEISFMFKIANLLHEPIDVIVKIFYPDEYAENQALSKKGKWIYLK